MENTKPPSRLFYEELRLLGKDSLEAILKLKRVCTNTNTHYIFINDHIGDVVVSFGYLKAFKEKHKIGHITVVVTEKFKELISEYSDDYDDVIYLDKYYLYRTFLLNLTRFGVLYLKKNYPNVTYINPADSVLLGFDYLKRYPEMNLEKMIKYGCYELDVDAEFKPLKNQAIGSNAKKVSSVPKALLSLSSRTIEPVQLDLYEKLICGLKELGYEVYTNTDDKAHSLTNSDSFSGSLNEISEFLRDGVLIGTRSGLHDLAMYQHCKVVAIYPENDSFGNLFKLDMLPETRADYLEVYQSENTDIDCKTILEFIKG